MLMVVLGAGIGLLLAGLAALGYGFLIKEFGLGNTLIQAGTVAACSGLLMVGLWAVGREVQAVAQRLGAGAAAALQPPLPVEPSLAPALAPPPSRNPPAADADATLDPAAAPPWVEDRDSAEASPAPPPSETAPPGKPKRNLLFTSTSRKERERAAARSSEPLAPDLLSADLRPDPPEDVPAAAAPQPPSFDDAWPKPDRAKPGDPLPRRSARAPSTFNEAGGNIPGREEAPQVTVLKSGVVDGMAYSLYSDGSIEAQMPEGMMRFASIDELRSHLDQRP
jgi:hypothetical protein